MELLKQDNFERDLLSFQAVNVVLKNKSVLLIEIMISAQSWLKNTITGRSFLKKDAATLRIDGQDYLDSSSPRSRYASVLSWNGNLLKGSSQILLIAGSFSAGAHSLEITPHQKPRFHSLRIATLDDTQNIFYQPPPGFFSTPRNQSPAIIFAVDNLALSTLKIDASAQKHKDDDDDVALIIDGERKLNIIGKNSHKGWHWCGKILKGADYSFDEQINLSEGFHVVELWVDGTPTISSVKATLFSSNAKRISTDQDPRWTGRFEDDSDEILLARLLLGEAENQSKEVKLWIAGSVLNRVKSSAWPNTIHDVILQQGQYDPFKIKDKNFQKIIDPLRTASDSLKRAWHESFVVAQSIISHTVNNPTTATHFHGKGVTRAWFIQHVVPRGKFIKRINDTSFYWSQN